MTTPNIRIIGGAYGEECAFPYRQMFRGSGGRAAAVLSSLGANVTLTTVLGPQMSATFHGIAAQLGYALDARMGVEDIWFRYRYPLGRPSLYPVMPKKVASELAVQAELALVFGMIEGRPPINAKRVVYDPQDGALSQHFEANGSTADELALIVSYSEGRALTGQDDPSDIADKLLAQPNVSIAVVKCGPEGALVRTAQLKKWIRSFITKKVYKIGSGDVFSAAFTFAWLMQNMDPLAAAWFASRVTAAYVEAAHDIFSSTQIPEFYAEAQSAAARFTSEFARRVPSTQIYLAGPFFNTAQQWLIEEVRGALRDMGFKVFSPVHDIGLGPPNEVAPADLFALEQSGLVLALLDGLDAGTLFEVGYARARNIPVVAVAEAVSDTNSLTMVLGSGCEVVNDLTTGIYAACWHLMGDV